MILKVGQAYLTRDGRRVLIERETEMDGTYAMQGKYEASGALTWRSLRGRFTNHPCRHDLVKAA